MSFGSELRQERERRGIGLADIAERTKVAERYLRALEDDDHSRLPGGVFNRGILRGYCQQLGLDESHWLGRFTAESPRAQQEHEWDTFAENVSRNRPAAGANRSRWWGVVAMLALLGALGWLAWHFVVRPRVLLSRPSENTLSRRYDSV